MKSMDTIKETKTEDELQVTFYPPLFLQRRIWILQILRNEGVTNVRLPFTSHFPNSHRSLRDRCSTLAAAKASFSPSSVNPLPGSPHLLLPFFQLPHHHLHLNLPHERTKTTISRISIQRILPDSTSAKATLRSLWKAPHHLHPCPLGMGTGAGVGIHMLAYAGRRWRRKCGRAGWKS